MKTPLVSRSATPHRCCLAVGLLTAASVLTANANSILNGGFESPVEPAGTTSVLPTDWMKIGPVTPLIFHGTVSGWPSPEEGSQFVDIGNAGVNAAISQTFMVGTAGVYDLTWLDNAVIGGGSAYDVDLQDSSSTVVATSSFTFSGASSWNARSLSVTLGLGSYTLEFTPTAPASDALLDNASLELASTSSVPDSSSSVLLLSMAVFGLAFFRSRAVRPDMV